MAPDTRRVRSRWRIGTIRDGATLRCGGRHEGWCRIGSRRGRISGGRGAIIWKLGGGCAGFLRRRRRRDGLWRAAGIAPRSGPAMSTGAGAVTVVSSALARGAASGDPAPEEKMALEETGARSRGASSEAMAARWRRGHHGGGGGDGGGGAGVCGAARDGSADSRARILSGAAFAGGEGAAAIDAAADGAAGALLATSAGGSLFADRATVRSGEAEELESR